MSSGLGGMRPNIVILGMPGDAGDNAAQAWRDIPGVEKELRMLDDDDDGDGALFSGNNATRLAFLFLFFCCYSYF